MANNESIRRCILSGEHGTRDRLIRLALSPEGKVLPDVLARAPGRGAWVAPDRAALETAIAKGRLKGALSRAFKTSAIAVPDDLADQVEAALKQRGLERLGLESRSGNLIFGHDRISDAIGAGRVRLLVIAEDAAEDGIGKLTRKLKAVTPAAEAIRLPADRMELSLALGRENVVCAALVDRAAADRVASALSRWRAYLGLIDRTGTCEIESQAAPTVDLM